MIDIKRKHILNIGIIFKRLKKYLNKILGLTISIRIKKNRIQKNEAYISYPIEEYKKNLELA